MAFKVISVEGDGCGCGSLETLLNQGYVITHATGVGAAQYRNGFVQYVLHKPDDILGGDKNDV